LWKQGVAAKTTRVNRCVQCLSSKKKLLYKPFLYFKQSFFYTVDLHDIPPVKSKDF
jgi:hypothetical protein